MNVFGSIESLWDCRIILRESQNIPLYTNCSNTILKCWLYSSVPRPAAKGGDGETLAASGWEAAPPPSQSAAMRWAKIWKKEKYLIIINTLTGAASEDPGLFRPRVPWMALLPLRHLHSRWVLSHDYQTSWWPNYDFFQIFCLTHKEVFSCWK